MAFLKNTPEYLTGIKFDAKRVMTCNPKSLHDVMGTVAYPLLQKYYSQALISIDLSTRGYTNYTHFEPLAYRTLSLIERGVVEDPDNIIPDDCRVMYDMADLETIINHINVRVQGFKVDPAITRIMNNGQKFIRQFDCKLVAQRILDNLKKL
jgi:hypothetical protein